MSSFREENELIAEKYLKNLTEGLYGDSISPEKADIESKSRDKEKFISHVSQAPLNDLFNALGGDNVDYNKLLEVLQIIGAFRKGAISSSDLVGKLRATLNIQKV